MNPVSVGQTASSPARDTAGHARQPRVALLALEGGQLVRGALASALRLCRDTVWRVDILMVSPTGAPTQQLGKFLRELEEEGIDFRLVTAEGDLGEAVSHYVQRHRQISMILLDAAKRFDGRLRRAMEPLRRLGCEVDFFGREGLVLM